MGSSDENPAGEVHAEHIRVAGTRGEGKRRNGATKLESRREVVIESYGMGPLFY